MTDLTRADIEAIRALKDDPTLAGPVTVHALCDLALRLMEQWDDLNERYNMLTSASNAQVKEIDRLRKELKAARSGANT